MQIKTIPYNETLEIRQRVLWPEKTIQHCMVDGDEHACHFGVFLDIGLVGVASTFDTNGVVRLRKFAVDEEHQGKGLGSALFIHALDYARCRGASVFWCDARETAVDFYKKFGMLVEGDRFYKSGIPYRKMSIDLINLHLPTSPEFQ